MLVWTESVTQGWTQASENRLASSRKLLIGNCKTLFYHKYTEFVRAVEQQELSRVRIEENLIKRQAEERQREEARAEERNQREREQREWREEERRRREREETEREERKRRNDQMNATFQG